MPNRTNTGTRDIPLAFARELSALANREWADGTFIAKCTPITQDLLRFWFEPAFADVRARNFHPGQRQAILNAIYAHEILETDSVGDMYSAVSQTSASQFTDGDFLSLIAKDKYAHPKYCVKMATGTGKTWVLNALLIWQYLNAKYSENTAPVKYTKNFLLVAPGLIVYERLLDAFLGKENPDGTRDPNTTDLKSNEELFIPERYRADIYSYLSNSVARKEDIGHKTTGDGIIAITNWHALVGEEETDADEIEIAGGDLENTKELAKEILPLSPGVAAGNALDTLDSQYLRGGILEYLSGLPDICVFNDEAHHIHEDKSYGSVKEVEWQKSLNKISEDKGRNFIQIDFSATPYDVTGSGERRTKHFFPHIIVDFDLSTAMRAGFVKTFVLDKRKEIAALASEDMDFKATRDENKKVVGLSDGQRVMLRAGLTKLRILEEDFTGFNAAKFPKMLVICEDTNVSPKVVEFLKTEGLSDDDIMQIDSGKKTELGEKEWLPLKQKLFALDKQKQPKVIVSVLMLREGFDVSNVCVIVPLRSSQAPILLEQVLGRGLRLMWREPEYEEVKTQNRDNIYRLKKEPLNYLDTLFVVEHPAFEKFYEDLDKDLIGESTTDRPDGGSSLGDMISVGLKSDYADYDMFWPQIIKDKEETLNSAEIAIDKMKPMEGWSLEQLQKMVSPDNAERFFSEEAKVKTRFGEYAVRGDLFTAQSYNEYLQKMLNIITTNLAKTNSGGRRREMPLMQIDKSAIVGALDKFIRTKLFNQDFDPMQNNNWRVLILSNQRLIEHVMHELSQAIYNMQNSIDVNEAIIEKHYFSSVQNMVGRENYALDIVKSIYEKTFYPSNKGGLERDFMLAADADSRVERIIKINENKHTFARFRYLRSDGMLSTYYPDFIVKIGGKIYVVETKGANMANNPDVQNKQRGALDWIAKINELKPEGRMNCEWAYALLTDTAFNSLSSRGADTDEILRLCRLTAGGIKGELDL